MISAIISRLVILVFGTLYPAYASYKAVRTKNLKEYVKWMMYWIVFALFTCTETFTDVFLSWFPFYYEVKIVLVLWLLSPATKGSSILYRKFVHPALCRREQEIDEYIAKAKDQGYHTVLNLGTKGVNYATTVIMQTAIKGGGGLVQQLRKSYSLSDLSECEPRDERGSDEADDVMTEPRLIRRTTKGGYATRRSASESNNRSPMYFPEVDVDVRPRPRSDGPDFSHIKSTEDISSGYSSADNSASLTRTASLGAGATARARAKTTRTTTVTTIKRPQAAEGEVIIEELQEDGFEYANMPPLLPPLNAPSPIYLSHSDPPFLYQYVGDQIKIIQVLGDHPLDSIIHNKNSNTDDSEKVTEINENIVKEIQITENKQNELKTTENADENILPPVNESNEKQNTELNSNESKKNETRDETAEPQKEIEKETEIKRDNLNEIIEVANQAIEDENTKTPNDTNIGEIEIKPEKEDRKISVDVDTSIKDSDSVESDDEASFGTPDNSPKSKKKNTKGKYGKAKAPQPPKSEYLDAQNNENNIEVNVTSESTSQESLVDFVNRLPKNPLKETGNFKGLQVINPIAENKRRHKSKSPGRIPKGNSSGISKLLHLPSKLAFWNKNEDKTKSDASVSSGDHSRRSSSNNIEHVVIDEFQSCVDLSTIVPNLTDISQTEKISHDTVEDDNNFTDAVDLENENISHEIIEKSDALQKLIEAKLESHPEYKIVSLHEEISTTSKSTDV